MQGYIAHAISSQLPSQAFLCYVIQMMICVALIWEINFSDTGNIGKYPESVKLVLVRFSCCIALHMVLQDELRRGIELMKFALNHSYRFGEMFNQAFFAGFMQTTASILIEVVNLLIILQKHKTEDIVQGFMKIAILAQFDNFFTRQWTSTARSNSYSRKSKASGRIPTTATFSRSQRQALSRCPGARIQLVVLRLNLTPPCRPHQPQKVTQLWSLMKSTCTRSFSSLALSFSWGQSTSSSAASSSRFGFTSSLSAPYLALIFCLIGFYKARSWPWLSRCLQQTRPLLKHQHLRTETVN